VVALEGQTLEALVRSELARLMGTSVAMIDERYGHLARDSEAAILARLEARSSVQRMDVRP
jgi:hypothetical protein